jgi:hypothetical protein
MNTGQNHFVFRDMIIVPKAFILLQYVRITECPILEQFLTEK